jgi:putative phosphoesterase
VLTRVAALYDIHGNLPALEAVLGEVRSASVDLIVIGGDVLPGPFVGETMSVLRGVDTPTAFIMGNGDRDVLARKHGTASRTMPEAIERILIWVAGELSAGDAAYLATLPPSLYLDIDGLGRVLFVHATPRNDTEIFTRNTPDERLAPIFAGSDAAVVVCGHTHMPFDRTVGGVRVVNAGSVGMPFGAPGADWLLLGRDVEPRHTSYDLSAAASRIRATSYPQAEEFAANNILSPPSAASMLAAFSAHELR